MGRLNSSVAVRPLAAAFLSLAAARTTCGQIASDDLGPTPGPNQIAYIAISPDCHDIAMVTRKDSGVEIQVDGKTIASADLIPTALFSPDSTHLAFVSVSGHQASIVLDGEKGAAYDEIQPASLQFSGDGRHVYYSARRGGEWFAVLDGREKTTGSVAPEQIILNGDGRHLAYVASDETFQRVVVDGFVRDAHFEIKELAVSDDFAHIAYLAATGAETWEAFLDGKTVGGHYFDVDHLALTHDGKRIAFAAYSANLNLPDQCVVVEDGVASVPAHRDACPPVFSPDGKHLTYDLEKTRPEVVMGIRFLYDAVMDGRPDDIHTIFAHGLESLVYDSTGAHSVAKDVYADLTPTNYELYYLIVDGKYLRQGAQDVTISPDGNHVASTSIAGEPVAVSDGMAFSDEIWLDGASKWHGLAVGPPLFSPDSSHFAYARLGAAGATWEMTLDGVADPKGAVVCPGDDTNADVAQRYSTDLPRQRTIDNGKAFNGAYPYRFDRDGTLVYFRIADRHLYRVRWKPDGQGFVPATPFQSIKLNIRHAGG